MAVFDGYGDRGGFADDCASVDDAAEHGPGGFVVFEELLLDVFDDELSSLVLDRAALGVSPWELFDDWPCQLLGSAGSQDVAACFPPASWVCLFVFQGLHELFGCGLPEQAAGVGCGLFGAVPCPVRQSGQGGCEFRMLRKGFAALPQRFDPVAPAFSEFSTQRLRGHALVCELLPLFR